MRKNKTFASDNYSPAHPAVLAAIASVNDGDAPSYGADETTARLDRVVREQFGASARVFPVFNGTAGNILGLSLMLRRYEAVICAETAHLNTDECGAIEHHLGCKLLTVPTPDGKLTPELVATRLVGRADEHQVQPRVVSITQSTEVGTCYSLEEIRRLVEFARSTDLYVHLDGARFANAAATLDCSLADLSAGIDALTFGGTKNGILGGEAVVVLREGLAEPMRFHRKQAMQLASKMRFLSAQFLALFEEDLWLRNARHANAMAARLAEGVSEIPGVEICYPVQANGVFARLPRPCIEPLQDRWHFYVWDEATDVVRWMTSFDTEPADVDDFVVDIAAAVKAVRG